MTALAQIFRCAYDACHKFAVCISQIYMYSKTEKDYRPLKDGGFGVITWLGVHGLRSRITYSFNAKDSPPKTARLSLFTNRVHAFVTSEIIYRLGEEELVRPKASGYDAIILAQADTTKHHSCYTCEEEDQPC